MSAAFDTLPSGACLCCAERQCPEHYSRELEPPDDIIAELQSIVVAMRHRGAPDDPGSLVVEMIVQARIVAACTDPVDQIRHSMALAAVAIRYREGITLP